ncbi:MAG: c-type cytochrome [Candidatus Longimicrobiales bacterium M2_2A_002]
MQRYATTILALLAILGTAGAVQAQQADTTESTEALVQRGAEVYSRQCQRCHVPRSPGERGDRDWIIIMQHMQARANLTREQARAALAFLLASNRSARRTAPGQGRVELTEGAVTDAMIEQGRTVFRGTGGCAACHGADLAGGPIAPSLVDATWKNGDGSLATILDVIRAGVEGTAMAAYPGGITEEQAARVAAYVWAVSQGRASP